MLVLSLVTHPKLLEWGLLYIQNTCINKTTAEFKGLLPTWKPCVYKLQCKHQDWGSLSFPELDILQRFWKTSRRLMKEEAGHSVQSQGILSETWWQRNERWNTSPAPKLHSLTHYLFNNFFSKAEKIRTTDWISHNTDNYGTEVGQWLKAFCLLIWRWAGQLFENQVLHNGRNFHHSSLLLAT